MVILLNFLVGNKSPEFFYFASGFVYEYDELITADWQHVSFFFFFGSSIEVENLNILSFF